jgi:hypothetical protein
MNAVDYLESLIFMLLQMSQNPNWANTLRMMAAIKTPHPLQRLETERF